MPDARETLKALAKTKRHKGIEVKVPPSKAKPIAPKKIKRDGPTRPYHQQLTEEFPSEADSASKNLEALPGLSDTEKNDDVFEEEIQADSRMEPSHPIAGLDSFDRVNSLKNKPKEKIHQSKHSPTNIRKAKTEKADSQLSENREANSDLMASDQIEVQLSEQQASSTGLKRDNQGQTKNETSEEKRTISESVLLEPQDERDPNTDLATAEARPITRSDGVLQLVSENKAQDEPPLIQSLQMSTDNQLSDNRYSKLPQTDLLTDRVGATSAFKVGGFYHQSTSVSPRRSGGKTVTNLAKRSLIRPDWEADFSRDESYLREYFRQVFGKGKYMKEVDLYCQLYSLAKAQQSITLHFLSAQIGELVGSSSNGTIRTRLITCEKMGLFVQQGFNNETPDHRRGTYVHLKFPWH